MKISEFRRWLEARDVKCKEGAKHTKLYYNGRQSTLPRHPGKELGEDLKKQIVKQLGL